MNSWLICLLLVAVVAVGIYGSPIDKKTDSKTTDTKMDTKKNATMIHIIKKNGTTSGMRQGRQLGYGNQYGSLGSQLSGISSGYGYGYNNAVGMGGLGASGAGAGYLPLLYGRR